MLEEWLMSITAKLLGDLSRFTDSPTITLAGGPRSLGQVLEELVRRYPSLRTQLFEDGGGTRNSLLLVAGGRSLKWPADEGSTIEDGGELVVMRYLAGG
jgi:molybdopterin converting factor small subunit